MTTDLPAWVYGVNDEPLAVGARSCDGQGSPTVTLCLRSPDGTHNLPITMPICAAATLAEEIAYLVDRPGACHDIESDPCLIPGCHECDNPPRQEATP